jgi:hypothetical protein
MKQKTFTFYCCIVGTCFGGMQKAFVKLEKCCFCNCSYYCGDLSYCCSHCCSRCRKGLRSCEVIQTGVVVIVCLKSSRCCSCWDANLQNSQCRIVIWDRKLLECTEPSFGSCKRLDVVIAGLLFGSCKKLEVVIAGPLFVNRIILFGAFGL